MSNAGKGKPPIDETRKNLNYALNLLDLTVLLYHIHRGAQHSEVGFEDADKTLKQLSNALQVKRATIPREVFESALWSCNLLDEVGEFWHPRGTPFKRWVKRMLKPYNSEFNQFYNWIEDGKK